MLALHLQVTAVVIGSICMASIADRFLRHTKLGFELSDRAKPIPTCRYPKKDPQNHNVVTLTAIFI